MLHYRIIALKGTCFDGRKQLLEALRRRFPDGTITLGVEATSKDVLDYWHSLQEDYRSDGDGERRICFGTSIYGLQDDSNYWFLSPKVNYLTYETSKLSKTIDVVFT